MEDISVLINNEELEHETWYESQGLQKQAIYSDLLYKPTTGNSLDTGTDRYIQETETFQNHVGILKAGHSQDKFKLTKTENESVGLKADENLEILKAGEEWTVVEQRKNTDPDKDFDTSLTDGQEPDRGILDLTKYLINSSTTLSAEIHPGRINDNHDTLAKTSGAANMNIDQMSKENARPNSSVRRQEPLLLIRKVEESEIIETGEAETKVTPFQVQEVPFRKRKLKFLKVFAIVSIVLFFPFGIPATYWAYSIEDELNKGIQKCNVDRAFKLIKRTEKLIIFSFIAAFLVAITVVLA